MDCGGRAQRRHRFGFTQRRVPDSSLPGDTIQPNRRGHLFQSLFRPESLLYVSSFVPSPSALTPPPNGLLSINDEHQPLMKTPRNLALLAVVLFVISHFLPAYGNGSGFACFQFCWNTLLGHDNHLLHDPDVFTGGWFYYSGFAISNILFVGLAVALFVTKKRRRLGSLLSVVIFLHVLSWLAIHAFQRPPQIDEIKIGYYAWLIAYALLLAAHLSKEPAQSLEPIPVAPSVV